jgi:hypothetical protein
VLNCGVFLGGTWMVTLDRVCAPGYRAGPGRARVAGHTWAHVSQPVPVSPLRTARTRKPAREAVRSGVPALVNIWVDPEVYAPGTMNQTMYK